MSNRSRFIILSLCLVLLCEIFFVAVNPKTILATVESYINIIPDGNDNKNLEEPIKKVDDEVKVPDTSISLMIVAHPDDETLWGGAHLLEDDYYVVCVTCGNVEVRNKEFQEIMRLTNNDYEFLGYPDLVNGYISNWQNDYDNIMLDIEKIIKSKNCKSIVTHNPEGEYGHFHHKTLSKIVTEVAPKDKLLYFGRYYNSENIVEMNKISDLMYNRKVNELLTVYKSQPKAIKRHMHMMPYENFIQYYDW